MATLLDTLKKSLGQAGAPEAVADETGQVRQLLAAKKGITGPAAAMGPVGLEAGEIAAKLPAQQQLANIRQGAQLQAEALQQAATGQELEQAQREAALSSQRKEASLQEKIQTENILRGLEQGKASLSEQQRQRGLEAAAANLRLQDQRYVDDLMREGQKARLQQDIDYGEQLAKSILEDNVALQKLKFQNQAALNADDREFKKNLAKLGYTDVIAMARNNAQAATEAATISGLATIPSIAGQAYGAYKSGSLSTDYQEYAEKERMANRYPMSYTTWAAKQEGGEKFVGPTRTQAGK